MTQREHVRQRAQQGVPIPRESFVWDGDTWQDRRVSQEPLYVMPRQTALVEQPSVLPAPQERPQHSVLSAPQEGPSPPLLPRSPEVRLATALRRERVLRRWQAFIYRYCECGVRVLRNGLHASTLSSGEIITEMVTDEGGDVLVLPVCVACKKAPATEICLGHLCNASRCSACVPHCFRTCHCGEGPYCPRCSCTCELLIVSMPVTSQVGRTSVVVRSPPREGWTPAHVMED